MIGQDISQFKIVEELGQAGLGEVYLARDTELGRLVSLKLLPPGLSERAEEMEKAFAEARAACEPSHPHICTVHGTGHHQGRPFVAMEVTEGESLASRIAEGPIDTDITLDFGVQIAEALQAAHARKVAHGALNMENVLITEGDQIKVMDFGIARLAGGSTGSGTDDIRALGVILYAMATGKSPGELSEGPDRPAASTVNPKAPAALDLIIDRALGTPEGGYGSFTEIAEDLSRVMIDVAPDYVPPTPEPVPEQSRTKGSPLALLAAAAVVLAAIVVLIRSCG